MKICLLGSISTSLVRDRAVLRNFSAHMQLICFARLKCLSKCLQSSCPHSICAHVRQLICSNVCEAFRVPHAIGTAHLESSSSDGVVEGMAEGVAEVRVRVHVHIVACVRARVHVDMCARACVRACMRAATEIADSNGDEQSRRAKFISVLFAGGGFGRGGGGGGSGGYDGGGGQKCTHLGKAK